MRRQFHVLAAAAFTLWIVAGGCAKEQAPPPSEPAKKESAAEATKTAPKPHVNLFTGTIVVLDAAAGTLTLKGKKGEKRFPGQRGGEGTSRWPNYRGQGNREAYRRDGTLHC